MGYLTSYSLSIDPGPHSPLEILAAFISAFSKIDTGLDLHLDNNPFGTGYFMSNHHPVKWYGEKVQMQQFSRQFPAATFLVHGEGEERDDVWEHRYQDGVLEERLLGKHWQPWQLAVVQ